MWMTGKREVSFEAVAGVVGLCDCGWPMPTNVKRLRTFTGVDDARVRLQMSCPNCGLSYIGEVPVVGDD